MVTCVCPVGLSVRIRRLNEFPSGDSSLFRTERTGFQTLQQSIEGHCVLHHSLVMVMKHKLGSPSKWLAVIKLSQPEGTFTGGNLGRRRLGTYSSTPKTQLNGTSPAIVAWGSFLALSKQFLQHSSQLRAGEWSAHTCPHL